MSGPSARARRGTQSKPHDPVVNKWSIVPLLACLYAVILHPFILSFCDLADRECIQATPPTNKFFWPALLVAAIALWIQSGVRLTLPRNLLAFAAYLGLAGLSVTWAYNPDLSFIRLTQQVMIVTSIALPALLVDRDIDLTRILFVVFGTAVILNLFYLLGPERVASKYMAAGYYGFYLSKNYLGQVAALGFLLSLREILFGGRRRVFGLLVATGSLVLVYLSSSKTALAVAFIAPLLALLAIHLWKRFRVSPVLIPIAIISVYLVIASISGFNVYRLSYMLYGDSSFTGRRAIWEFAQHQISKHPLLGWGYQSFWHVGADAPSVREAPGFVKSMPNAHNGYLDTILETGYLGFFVLLIFIGATLHASRHMISRNAQRAWLVLSLCFFVIISNGLESTWVRAFEFMWVGFFVSAVEVGRHSQAFRWKSRSTAAGSNLQVQRLGTRHLARAYSPRSPARVRK